MAYVTPRTWVTGELVTAAEMNQDVRDNISALANPEACRAYHNTTQSVTDNTDTTVAFNTESYDTASIHSTVTNNSRFTLPKAGLWEFDWNVQFAADTDFLILYHYLRKNGTTKIWDQRSHETNILNDTRELAGFTTKKLALNDYVELRVYQDNGSNNAVNLSTMSTDLYGMTVTYRGIG